MPGCGITIESLLFDPFSPRSWGFGEIVQQPVATTKSLGDDFFAGYALAFVAIPERQAGTVDALQNW